MENLKIRAFEDNNIPIIKEWLEKSHIKKWYEHPEDWLYEINERHGEFSFIKHFIIIYNDKPIGFCQYYRCREFDSEWSGEGTYSIDYLIGEEEYLKRGFGKAAVRILIETVFSLEDSRIIIVQPEQENIPSCRTLLASGFAYNTDKEYYYISK